MCKYLFALLFIPQVLRAQQEVKPVISGDYLVLINNDTTVSNKGNTADSTKKTWRITQPYTSSFPVKTIRLHNGTISIIPQRDKYLAIGGTFTSSAAITSINAMPLLQNSYAQGRSLNGGLTWQGPETNEVFSYGPPIGSLEYDGSVYPYDVNGRLVNNGAGNGKKAIAYNNSIFRKGYVSGQSFSLLGSIKPSYWPPSWQFAIKASKTNETTVVKDNNNDNSSFSASVEKNIKHIAIDGTYNSFTSYFSNSNRGGFLNRAYENSLLAPASFDNSQGYKLQNGNQRSYSNSADNPLFLLEDGGHLFKQTQQAGGFSVQNKYYDNFKFAIASSFDATGEESHESLKPGTASFPSGVLLSRRQQGRHYTVNSYAAYNIKYGYGYHRYSFSSLAKVNSVFNSEKVDMSYLPANANYHYQRSSNDFSIAYNTTLEHRGNSAGLNAGDKFYGSNTAPKSRFWLPEISGFIWITNLFDGYGYLKLSSTYNSFYSEPAIGSSYALYGLTQIAPQDAFNFMPVTEAQGFNNLQPITHREFTYKIEAQYGYWATLSADVFTRKTMHDVFPVYQSGALVLENIADTRFNGYEIQFDLNIYPRYNRKFSISTTVSFYKWNNTVLHVESGYNNTPIAGFANVHKTIIEGKPLGVIVGNTYARNANDEIMIGSDGFPLVNNQLSVIGNPIPDYTLKFSHIIKWKALSLNIDWEYKKGGDVWNGTQALLDYYGRSATTGDERNYTNYIFNGVNANGRPNNIPVAFYDASRPVENNRWVQYGYTGVAESYIEKADAIRIHNIAIAYDIYLKKYLQKFHIMLYAENLIIWQAYKGADPNQSFYGDPGSSGLDFFNLPSTKSFGINLSIQF